MGKKGDALRALKAQRVTRTFTEAQLREHDRAVIHAYEQERRKQLSRLAREAAYNYRDEVTEDIRNEKKEYFFEVYSLLVSTVIRVLVQDFGWIPIKNHRVPKNSKFVRLLAALGREVDEMHDLEKYCEETYELYGIKAKAEDVKLE